MLHKLNFGVRANDRDPLLQKHRILTQVAGYHTEVIKFLPPITSASRTSTGSQRDEGCWTTRSEFPGRPDTVAGLAWGLLRANVAETSDFTA
jgi:hypothetical protein